MVLIKSAVAWILSHVYFWVAVPTLVIFWGVVVYFLGIYTPAELSSFFMSRKKRKIFFTVKRWNTLLGGYSHGYVTGMYEKDGKNYYSVIWIFGGASLATDSPEESFE